MKILLVCPEYENTFWNFKEVLKIVGRKSAYPPLGLLTISPMLPGEWEKKLIDMNCEALLDDHIMWADYVFISAMVGQKKSTREVIDTIQKLGKPIVAGGSLFSTSGKDYSEVETIVIGEVEDIFPAVVEDLKKNTLKKIYSNNGFPAIKKAPIPDWDLINMPYYNSMVVQFSRGCPYDCEFCDVVQLNGRNPRIKSNEQFIAELDSLYDKGWRAGVFIVDDNFMGNKNRLKKEFLPAIIEWQKKRKFPFILSTQISINLADDDELMKLMVGAGFATVFVGIETPDPDGLKECGKHQNENRDLVESVKKIQNMGMEVNGGFILGFDSDKPSIFESQIEFIQKSGIVTAMVGLLNVSPKTRLHQRLKKSKRLVKTNDSASRTSVLNFIPKMDADVLIDGYERVVSTIYSPEFFYDRIKTFLEEFRPKKVKPPKLGIYHIRGFIGSIWYLGFIQAGRYYYWKLITWSLFKKISLLPYAIGLPLGLTRFKSFAWVKQYNIYYRD